MSFFSISNVSIPMSLFLISFFYKPKSRSNSYLGCLLGGFVHQYISLQLYSFHLLLLLYALLLMSSSSSSLGMDRYVYVFLFRYLCIYLSIYRSTYLSTCLFIHRLVSLYLYLPLIVVCLSVSI